MINWISLLLAQVDVARYNRGLRTFKLGLTAAGVGILMAAFFVAISKSKNPEKAAPAAVRWMVFTLFVVLGVGLIAYAWLIFK